MKRNLYLMYTTAFLQGLVFYGPVSLLFRMERGLSVGEFFFLDFLLMIIGIVTEVPWGYFADKYGYKKTLVISYSLFFLSRVALLFCHGFNDFVGQTILMAISLSGISGCDIAFLYNSCGSENTEKIFGRYRASGSFAFFIASICSYFIISKSMEFAVFLTVIAYGLSVVMICFTKDIDLEKSIDKKCISIKKCLENSKSFKHIFIFVIATTLIADISYGISINLGQLHFKGIGLEIKYLGYISAFSELLGMLSCKTYILSNKFGQYKTLKAMIVVMLICIAILIFNKSIFVSIIAIVGLSGLISMISPIVLDIKNKSISKNRATMLSVYSMVGSVASAFISIAIGFCADIYLKYAFMICFVIMGIGLYGVYLYISKEKYNEI
ncbi:MFS transporter [Romboutsia sedimentorum]|uniref:MFS transporter n=1 Tax=Romboutsia sedimentorum TaxID=1368474 RepID=A0ABT7EAP2_9FIRM|nr:MFS transporter [Romboutsia sedimentorum]MDK2563996.1 MFS transporter [Romboutsia sedimentorum]